MFDRIDYYRVQWGDTLESISEDMYGTKKFHGVLFRHNSSVITDPNQLSPGLTIAIPKLGGHDLTKAIIRNLVDDDDDE